MYSAVETFFCPETDSIVVIFWYFIYLFIASTYHATILWAQLGLNYRIYNCYNKMRMMFTIGASAASYCGVMSMKPVCACEMSIR